MQKMMKCRRLVRLMLFLLITQTCLSLLIYIIRQSDQASLILIRSSSLMDDVAVRVETMIDDVTMIGEVPNHGENITLANTSLIEKPGQYDKDLQSIFSRYPWMERKRFTPNYFIHGLQHGDSPVEMMYKDFTYVFVHNQKSGGTTLKSCIDKVTTRKKMPKYVGLWDERAANLITQEINSKQRRSHFYVSENTFGVCEDFTARNCSYFTLIRDPYERIISCHEFCKRALGDPLCAASDARKMTLKQWALHQGSYFFRQLQFKAKYVCSDKLLRDKIARMVHKPSYWGKNYRSPPCWYRHKLLLDNALSDTEKEVLLKYFQDNLENWFTVIGIKEEYRMTLSLLQQAYKLPFRDLCNNLIVMKGQYKDGGRPAVGQSQSNLITRLKAELQADPEVSKALYYDVKIYEKAREIFEEQKRIYHSHE